MFIGRQGGRAERSRVSSTAAATTCSVYQSIHFAAVCITWAAVAFHLCRAEAVIVSFLPPPSSCRLSRTLIFVLHTCFPHVKHKRKKSESEANEKYVRNCSKTQTARDQTTVTADLRGSSDPSPPKIITIIRTRSEN